MRAFRQAHPPGIDPVQAHVGLPAVDQPEHVPDRRHARHPWALWAFPGAHTHEDRPRALQRALVPAADAGEREASIPLRDRLLGEDVQAVRPARRYTELIRSPSVGGHRPAVAGLSAYGVRAPSGLPACARCSPSSPLVHTKQAYRCSRSLLEARRPSHTSTGSSSRRPQSGFVQRLSRWTFFHL